MPEWISRQKRIAARVLLGKKVPRFVYRQDSRGPDEIRAAGGFQPYATTNEVSLIDHVIGSFSSGDRQGRSTKEFSRWVSTGSYRMLQELDPVIANRMLEYYIYKIDTQIAGEQDFYDANDVFDRAGVQNIHKTQREWTKENGVPANAIVGYLKGIEFYNMMQHGRLPDEGSITWHPF